MPTCYPAVYDADPRLRLTTASDAAIIGGDFGAKTSFPGDYQQSLLLR